MTIKNFSWLKDALKAYKSSNFPSSLIIEGETGLAKAQLANYFAQKLLCSESSNCGDCNSCNYFLAGSHPDFAYLSSDSRTSNLVPITKSIYSRQNKQLTEDKINSKTIPGMRGLTSFMHLSHSVSSNRVSIIFDAEFMNESAQNSLLKTLEELPDNKFIILVSSKRNCFLPTIYSRSKKLSINNPSSNEIDIWISSQGYIDFSSLNFAPDSTPLQIERMINNDLAGQYLEITENLNSYCIGQKTTPDLMKFYKEINITFEEKINSIILFLKTCVGINQNFYKSHPSITAIESVEIDSRQASDLIEELVDYKYQLNQVPSLNEQIGLNAFFYKIKNLCS
tara:strand:+ start:2690 stop:3706 length:1017 start_codon:yes stop_codon:yes gene_type:complete